MIILVSVFQPLSSGSSYRLSNLHRRAVFITLNLNLFHILILSILLNKQHLLIFILKLLLTGSLLRM